MKKIEAQYISDKIVAVLKEERLKQQISQYKLAKDIGMSKSSILYIESLTQKPSLYTVILISNYLGLNLDEVVKKANEN